MDELMELEDREWFSDASVQRWPPPARHFRSRQVVDPQDTLARLNDPFGEFVPVCKSHGLVKVDGGWFRNGDAVAAWRSDGFDVVVIAGGEIELGFGSVNFAISGSLDKIHLFGDEKVKLAAENVALFAAGRSGPAATREWAVDRQALSFADLLDLAAPHTSEIAEMFVDTASILATEERMDVWETAAVMSARDLFADRRSDIDKLVRRIRRGRIGATRGALQAVAFDICGDHERARWLVDYLVDQDGGAGVNKKKNRWEIV